MLQLSHHKWWYEEKKTFIVFVRSNFFTNTVSHVRLEICCKKVKSIGDALQSVDYDRKQCLQEFGFVLNKKYLKLTIS